MPENERIVELPEHIRAFVAIPLPADIRERIARFQRDLKSEVGSDAVRWVPPEQIHLTLKFLGDIASESVPGLCAALSRACAGVPAFELRAAGVGAFPDRQRPRVFWVGLSGGLNSLPALRQNVLRETEAWGEREEREFHPHLTLGRVREGRGGGLRDWTARRESPPAPEFGAWRVSEIVLMRSELSAGGARHSGLAVIPLREGL